MIHEKKHTVHCQGSYFWGDAHVLGYGRLKKKVQGKDTLNDMQGLPCRRWCCSPILFLHLFLRFFLLLLLHNSGKLAISHDHLFLILQIIHIVLFKSLQCQGELRIYWRADLTFSGKDLLWSIFECHFWKVFLLVLQQYSEDCVVIGGRSKPFVDRCPYTGVFAVWKDIELCYWPRIWVNGAQCKCKCWFMFYAFLWTYRVTEYFRLSCELVGWLTIAKFQALEIFYCAGGRWK